MNRLNRRRFLALGAASSASVVLVACGNESPADVDLNPTQMPDVAGAPPTLAPITSTPQAQQGGGEEQAAGGDEGAGGGAAGTVEIEAGDLYYDPTDLELAPGDTVVMNNAGMLQHNLVIEDWDNEEVIPLINGGESAEWTVPDDVEIGSSVVFYCSVPGHREAGMEGTFTFVEASAAAAGGEEEATAEGEEAAAGGGGATSAEVTAVDIAFEPTELSIAADTDVTITVTNNGMLQHDFVVEETDFATDLLNGGETAELVVNLPEGEYVYFCSVPGHREAGMEGTLTVAAGGGGEEAAAAGAAEEEATAAEGEGEEAAAAGGGGGAEPLTIISLDSLAYDPSEAEVSPGQTVILQNDGFLQHDIAVDEWGGALTDLLNNGETGEFTIPEDAAVGEQFVYYCTVAGHREGGMEGTFTIVEGAAAGGGEEDAAAAGAAEEEAGTPAAEGEGEEAAATSGGDASDPTNVTVVASEWAFEPADFEVVPGGTIMLVNEGTVGHGMAAEALGGAFLGPVRAGGSAQYRIPSDAQPGDTIEYTAINSSAAELGMGGTITIIEGEGGEAAAGASPEASPAATPEAAAAGGGSSMEPITILTLDSLAFDPSEVDVAPGQTIIVQNDGFLQHDLAVDEWGGALTELLNNGQTGEFTIPEDVAEGEQYIYYCTVAGHRQGGMEGTFTIVGGGGGGAATEASPAASPAASPEADEAASGGGSDAEPLTIIALDSLAFDPSEADVSPGQTVILQNDGFLQHDIAVDEWGGALTDLLNNGQTGEFTIPEDAEVGAEFTYYCTVAGHRQGGMEGTFTIV